ncbi:MAG: beta-N-acetylglucosaminidase domain-containing protein [Roseburia sp.]|nr:beta-N-acetylglucosaminidase domain-containing protein [Roseburia sp.]
MQLKRKLALLLAMVIAISSMGSGMSLETYAAEVEKDLQTVTEDENSQSYAIYPIPQNTTYGEGELVLTTSVVIVAEPEVDTSTRDYIKEVLDEYQVDYEFAETMAEDKTNILLGTYGSAGVVEQYVNSNGIEISTENIWNKPDAHVVDVKDNRIVIYGSDTDSVFHGVSTLKMMFSSFAAQKFPAVHIEDFASVESRGFIEGFYGSWNHQARMDLMRFGKDYKLNSYVYAAKGDSYHTSNWHVLYPAEMMNQFEELVAVGEETKVRFAWSVHMGSFFSGLTIPSDQYETRYAQLIAKFEQLIGIGVKRFDILNDDFGSGSHSDVVLVLNRINRDLKARGCESITYCPQGYNKAWSGNGDELAAMCNLDEDIKIYWTGDDVNAPITQDTINFVTERSKHLPDFWLNFPVNEHAKSGIFLGHIKHYARDGVTGMAGFHSNPCRYPYASQVGLYQLAALVWNNNNFLDNAEKIWKSTFDYLQPEVTDAYFKIANHISNAPNSSRVGNNFPESDAIETLLNTVLSEVATGAGYKDSAKVAALRKEFVDILAAIEEFNTKCANQGLIKELTPWLNSLKDLATAGRDILDSAIAMDTGDLSTAWLKLSSASTAYSTAYTYKANSDNDSPVAKAGSKRIYPFVGSAINYVTNSLTPMLNPDNAEVVPSAFVKMGGVVQNDDANAKKMYDGDSETCANWNTVQKVGDYVGLDLGRTIKVTDIHILQGTNDNDHDILHKATLQYSIDNQQWNNIDAQVLKDGHEVVADGLEIQARYIRYYLNEEGYNGKPDYWTHIREFTVNKPVQTGDRVFTNIESLKETPVTYEGTNISVRNLGNVTLQPGEYIGVKLLKPAVAYSFNNVVSNSKNLTLEYSYNEEQWTIVEENTSDVAMKYLRLINRTNTAVTTNIEKIEANLQLLQGEMALLASTMNGGIETGSYDLVFDGERSTYVKTKGNQQATNYITFDLGKNIEIHDVTLVTTDGNETFSKAKVQISSDNSGWKDIGVINDNMEFPGPPYKYFRCNGEGEQARYLRIYITENTNTSLKLNEIEINQQVEGGKQADEIVSNLSGNVKAVIDNNIGTAMVASVGAGAYVEYRISENTNITKVNVLMGSAGAGKAYAVNGAGEEILLGTLDQSVSEFDTTEIASITAIRLKWEQVENISLHEIIPVRGSYKGSDIGVYVEPIWENGGEEPITNIALGKTVTVSGTTAGAAPNVVDGDINTKWDSNTVAKTEAGTETAWIQIDLGTEKIYEISSLIVQYFNLIWPTRYTVEVSEDGENWSQIGEEYNRNSGGTTYPVDTIEFTSPVKARYVKLNFAKLNANAAGTGVGIREFEIYGRTYTGGPAISETTLLSEGQPVEISGVESQADKAEYINDGDNNTRWNSNYIQKGSAREGETSWFSIDLGETPVLIEELSVSYYNKVYPTVYELQVSNDNTNWYTVDEYTKASNGPTYPTDTITLETPIHARYVRWFYKELNSAAGGNGVAVTEAKVFGRTIHKEAEITAVADVEDITLPVGGEFHEDALAEFNKVTIKVQKVNAPLTVEIPVSYGEVNVDTSVDGTTMLTGQLQLSGIKNTTNKDVSVKVVVGTGVTPSEPEAVEEKLKGYTLSLEGTVGVNFHMQLGATVLNDTGAYMNFTLDGKEYQKVFVKDATYVENTDSYVFKCGVPVKDMDTEITAQIILSDEQKGSVYTYSVRDYIEYIADNKEEFQKELALVETMSTFGNTATAYFAGERVDAIPELTETQLADLASYKANIPENDFYFGSSLLLKSDTILRHYFTKYVDGSTQKGDLYYIESEGIPAHKLGADMEMTVSGIKITYNPLSYVYIALTREGVDENLRNVMRAMYLYYQEAQAYKDVTTN